jgi:hypothetical protein
MSIKAIACLLLTCVAASACWGLDREAFTFTRYDLEVRIEPGQQRLGVRGTITLRNDSGSAQRNLALQLSSSLAWRSIQLAGKPVQFVAQPYTSDIDHTGALSEAIVTLPKDLPTSGTLELTIGYEGTVPLDATRLIRLGVPEGDAKHSDWDQIGESYTAVRGFGYVLWYPAAAESANLSEGNSVFEAVGRWQHREQASEMRINLCIGSSGSQLAFMNDYGPAGKSNSDQSADLACQEHRFDPLGQTVPAIIMGRYELLSRLNIDIEYMPQDKAVADDYALAADLAEPFVRDWVGAPRQKARMVELADGDASPFESGTLLLAPGRVAKDSRLAQMTAVHQLTHGAFFSSRPWINEGFAHFAQAAYREQQSNRQGALDFMSLYLPAIAAAEKSVAGENNPAKTAEQSLINTSLQEFYRSKAMYVWWMLRDMVGDVALKKALAAYVPGDDKDPAYVQHLIEAQSKRDLEWFFDDWVYREKGLPDFRVNAAVPRATLGGAYVVTVTVEDLGDVGAEVPIKLIGEGGDVTKRLQVPARGKASIRIELPSVPQQIVVNDGSVPENNLANNSFKISVPTAR